MTSILDRPAAPVVADADPTVVTDNAKYAWDNSRQGCLAALPEDFVFDYRAQLDAAAIAAIEPFLVAAWKERGFGVRFGTWQDVASGNRVVWDETYWAMWDRAADALDAYDLVDAAGLNDELNGYMEGDD